MNRLPEWKAMDIGKEDEEIIIIPKEEPVSLPAPSKEPERVPAHTGHLGEDDGRHHLKEFEEEMEGAAPKVQSKKLIGYRHGNLVEFGGQWKLRSPSYPVDWERGPTVAVCNGNKHEAPSKGCHCGIYARFTEDGLRGEFGNSARWVTQVNAWGKAFPAQRGFRAQTVQIQAIKSPLCELCSNPATNLARLGNTALGGSAIGGLPVCEKHLKMVEASPQSKRDDVNIHLHPMSEVAKSLSSFYGVPVLSPKEEFEHGGEGYEKEDGEKAAHLGWKQVRQTPSLDPNAGKVDDEDRTIKPRVDPYAGKALEEAQMGQVNQEAKKLQKGMRQINQTMGSSSAGAVAWDVVDGAGNIRADGDALDFGGSDEANDWRIHNEPDPEWFVQERFAGTWKAKSAVEIHDPKRCLERLGMSTAGLDEDDVADLHGMAHVEDF